MSDNVPNLDAEDTETLWAFQQHHQDGRHYREIFPAGGKGTKSAAGDLSCYAANKATAMVERLAGRTVSATIYEDICDRIYDGLPQWARW